MTLQLQQELGRSKKEADALRADGAKLRATLVTHIAGPSANVDNFKNVSLDDMFRIYQKQASGDGGRGSTRGGRRVRSPGSRPTSRASKAGSTSGSQAGGSGDEAGDAGAGGGAGGSGSGGDEDMPEALHQVLAAEREVQTLRTYAHAHHAWVGCLLACVGYLGQLLCCASRALATRGVGMHTADMRAACLCSPSGACCLSVTTERCLTRWRH